LPEEYYEYQNFWFVYWGIRKALFIVRWFVVFVVLFQCVLAEWLANAGGAGGLSGIVSE
jgi:hypothetical protein